MFVCQSATTTHLFVARLYIACATIINFYIPRQLATYNG